MSEAKRSRKRRKNGLREKTVCSGKDIFTEKGPGSSSPVLCRNMKLSETASAAAGQKKDRDQTAVVTAASASVTIAGTSAAAAAGEDHQKPDDGTASVSSK